MMKRKNAEILAQMLEGGESGRTTSEKRSPEAVAELEPLVQTAQSIRSLPNPAPSEMYRRASRARLLQHAARRAAPAARFQQRLTFQLGRALAGMAVLMVILTLGGAGVFAAGAALPGDLLYPAKLALEAARLMAAEPGEKVILHSNFASNRLTEIQLLIVHNRFDDIETAAARFQDHVNGALVALAQVARRDSAATYPILLQIEQDLKDYGSALARLQTIVPAETRLVLARAIEASQVWQ